MKKLYTLVLIVVIGINVSSCNEEQPNLVNIFNQIESVTVYDLEGLNGNSYSASDLNNTFSADLDAGLLQKLAPAAKYKNEWVLWKGSRLANVKLSNGKEHLLALSYYGGFFKLLEVDGYFYFEGEAREKWNQEFSVNIIQNNFIPKRIVRNKSNEN